MMTDGAYNTLRQTENNQKVNCDTASLLRATPANWMGHRYGIHLVKIHQCRAGTYQDANSVICSAASSFVHPRQISFDLGAGKLLNTATMSLLW